MIQLNDVKIKSLIDSNDGIHLSAYISHHPEQSILRHRIKKILLQATDRLQSGLTVDEIKLFLLPIEKLLHDKLLLSSLKENIAIFRTETSFKIISLPVTVSDLCVIATSFHVKPILRWLQTSRNYLLLAVEEEKMTIYKNSMGRLNQIASTYIDKPIDNAKEFQEISNWVEDVTNELLPFESPVLFVAAKKKIAKNIVNTISYLPTHKKPIGVNFTKKNLSLICARIHSLMHSDSRRLIGNTMMEYHWAETQKLAQDNLYQISIAAVQGRIKKLIIADDVNIFGKLCQSTGDLTVNIKEKDHEDDDILDDLAQTVLLKGGEILVVDKKELPDTNPALAILERDETSVTKVYQVDTTRYFNQYIA